MSRGVAASVASRLVRLAALTLAPLLVAACASAPPVRLSDCAMSDAPQVTYSADGRTAHMRLTVLSYNIEGLTWPARSGREGELNEIGGRLAQLRRAGQGPDIVLFQEVFSPAAARAVMEAGYPAQVAGPSAWHRRDLPSGGRTPGHRSWKRGEIGVKMTGGGLAIASRWPIAAHKAEPFSHKSCAGFDCLANKGALFARLTIPGVPEPLDIFDSHMNSRRASRAKLPRTLAAHEAESRELAAFIAQRHEPDVPMLLGGDFNMRHSPARFEVFEQAAHPLTVVQRYCAETQAGCDYQLHRASDTPWLDSEDLQLFRAGRNVDVRPVSVASIFDGRAGPELSDHDGLLVTYELSWAVDAPRADGVCPAAPVGVTIATAAED
jgi:endonuclease/exonuclease/phosphatase family metal-dependent hydrolase